MPETISPEKLWKPYDVLIGGLGALSVEKFVDDEIKVFDKFIEDSINALTKISPEVAEDFKAQAPFFRSVGEVFKDKVDKAFGGILPSSGQFGVGLIIPQDIVYYTTADADHPCYSDYAKNKWDISLAAGSAAHLLGDGTHYYKARRTTLYRCALVIMKNGFLEVGTSPSINQFLIKTERTTYPAFSVHPLVDQTIEEGYTIYRYNLPFGIPIFHDFGIMIDAMPTVTKTSNLRMVGVVFYE
ncbi:MAG: hypothetical protein ACE5Z5_09530, partial [Candidatus Bathyarchaeia archaeon]